MLQAARSATSPSVSGGCSRVKVSSEVLKAQSALFVSGLSARYIAFSDVQIGVYQTRFHPRDRAVKQSHTELLHPGALEFHPELLGVAGVRGDERQVDLVVEGAREEDRGLFRLFLDTPQAVRLPAQIHAVLPVLLGRHPIHAPMVPRVPAKGGVAVGGFDVEQRRGKLQHDVEGAASEAV